MHRFLLVLCFTAVTATQLGAAVIGYTSRASCTTDVGPASWTQDFESFIADTSFQVAPVVAGNLTLQQSGSSTFRNLIDVLPLGFGEGASTERSEHVHGLWHNYCSDVIFIATNRVGCGFLLG